MAGLVFGGQVKTTSGTIQTSLNGSSDAFVAMVTALPIPTISTLSYLFGPSGTEITIYGNNFGSMQGSGSVNFGGTTATINTWSSTSIVATVPSGLAPGTVQVSVVTSLETSNQEPFLVSGPPTITSLSSSAGAIGSYVTINGSGFGPGQTNSPVTFNGTIASATGWTDTRIVVTVPGGATTGPVAVTVDGFASNGLTFIVTSTPVITSVSPNSGTLGTQVTIAGSGFGTAQGSGTVYLGSRTGAVVSWSDTQIVANVSAASVSGAVQVLQSGTASNSAPFTVNTATIATVSPTSGATGTQVTIAGSGFGSAEGSGQVWLGTAAGSVTSWSDGQVVATVAAGSNSGNAQILQNGVWSNSVPFTVTGGAPNISYISPNVGDPGTVITIQGAGFGSSQGSGIALIGGANGSVSSWSDTQVTATVGSGAISGVLKIQQNGVWSNSVTFTVPSAFSSTFGQVTLNPNVMNMLVGDTRPIVGLGANGKPVPGLTWTSSDTTIATLSTDDPPIITGVAPGNATITAGGALADVTVYAAGSALPVGTVLWSDPGNGSGVAGFYPAVPSPTGVADTFALQNDGSVLAITSDGAVAWSSSLPSPPQLLLPDFQGGAVVTFSDPGYSNAASVEKLDGLTGIPYPAYTTPYNATLGAKHGIGTPAIHTDGTIFVEEYADTGYGDSTNAAWVTGIDPSTGTVKFRVPAAGPASTTSSSAALFCVTRPGVATGPTNTTTTGGHPLFSNLMIAGDGYAYTSYITAESTQTSYPSAAQPFPVASYPQIDHYLGLLEQDTLNSNTTAALSDLNVLSNLIAPSSQFYWIYYYLGNGDFADAYNSEVTLALVATHLCDGTGNSVSKLHILRVGTDGSSSDVVAYQWSESGKSVYTVPPNCTCYTLEETQTAPLASTPLVMTSITNADQGAVFSWSLSYGYYGSYCADTKFTYDYLYINGYPGPVSTCITGATQPPENHLTTMNESGGISDVVWGNAVQPILQLADGSFVGSASDGSGMVAFDASGNVKWTVPGYNPDIATADGGIIADTGSGYYNSPGPASTFDATGNATGELASFPTQSWIGNEYQGSVAQVFAVPRDYAPVYAALGGGNQSVNGTAIKENPYPRLKSCVQANTNTMCAYDSLLVGLEALQSKLAGDCPNCVQYVFAKFGSTLGSDQKTFSRFINRRPYFFDGTKSTLLMQAVAGDLATMDQQKMYLSLQGSGLTVENYFNQNPGTIALAYYQPLSAQSPVGADGLKIFFNPNHACIDSALWNSPCGLYNQSLLFHEGLHEFYGFADDTIQIYFMITISDTCTANIGDYIENYVYATVVNSCQ